MKAGAGAVLFMTAVLSVGSASTAHAGQKLEVGVSVAGATVGFKDNGVSTVGIPASGVGVLTPGVYASLFLGPRIAIEPQVGFVWVSSGGSSLHILNVAGQADYFFDNASSPSGYLFATAGVLDLAASATAPKSIGGGIGYRILYGDRLTFRMDSRFVHFNEGGGNVLTLSLSIGGVIVGRR